MTAPRIWTYSRAVIGRRVALLLSLACVPPVAPAAPSPAPSVEAAPAAHGDACQKDIPDCEAACAMREANRTQNLEWFDRRCAAVVLGKNPDKAVGYEAPVASAPASAPPAFSSAPVSSVKPSCDPPFTLGADGVKRWKRDCVD